MTRCKKRRVTGTRCELFRLEACGTSPFSRDFPPPGKALKCRRIFHGIFRRIGNTTGRSAVDRGFDSPEGFFMGRWRACIRRCGETRCAMRRRLEHNRDARSRLMSAYIYIYILSAKRVCVTLGAMQISSISISRDVHSLFTPDASGNAELRPPSSSPLPPFHLLHPCIVFGYGRGGPETPSYPYFPARRTHTRPEIPRGNALHSWLYSGLILIPPPFPAAAAAALSSSLPLFKPVQGNSHASIRRLAD